MEIKLSDEVLDAIADEVESRLALRKIEISRAPLKVCEFAKATNQSKSQVYRSVDSGEIRRVEGLSKVLIPASELDRYH